MDNVLEFIGNTEIKELSNIYKKYNLKSKIFAKLELNNPTGSIKDRAAFNMIKVAEENKLINENSVIVEASSGNIGISLAYVGKVKNYKVIIVMPENMSKERIKMMEDYGAQVILTSKEKGMQGAIDKVNELLNQNKNYICLKQFENTNNKTAHYKTGTEIINQVSNIDIFINGIGTGGTISGVGEYLKSKNENIQIIGIEPAKSPLITKGISSSHGIQGIGANFIPKILNLDMIDKVLTVDDEDAIFYKNELYKEENIFCGISAGANLKIAIDIAKKEENKNIVIIIPDKGDRYYSIN